MGLHVSATFQKYGNMRFRPVNMSDRIVSDIQCRAAGETFYIRYTIRARILYCAYEMKSTLLFAPRREFAHFSIRYNRGANIVLCL